MGFSFSKILGGAKKVLGTAEAFGIDIPFDDQIIRAIHLVELIPGLKGQQKKETAKAIVANALGVDGLFLKDSELATILDRFIDDYVALVNRLGQLKHKD